MADSVEVSTIETTDGTIGIIRDNAARQSIANLREGKETVGSVAWENVKGRPTKVSSFENDKKYQTDENVSNTLNSTLYAGSSTHGGPATSADKLTTARTISLGGAASGSGSFDGSANSTINVSSLDATKLTGVVPITNLPPSVIERMSIVKDDTERFALTKDSVQDGDVVKVQSSGLIYYVVDDDKLNEEAGYEVFKAGTAASVPWGGITDKPSSYPPSSHTHTKSQITDFPSSMPNPNNLTMRIEGNDAAVYNGGTAQTFNVTKSALGLDKVNNTADADKSVKYASSAPWIGVTGKPSTFPPSAHTHTKSQITDLGVFGGASATAAGSTGLVPQPAAGDQDKYLSAKGTWESITGKISGTKVASANSADKLTTARTLTIGNTAKSFDGSANVSWSLSEIGALGTFNRSDVGNAPNFDDPGVNGLFEIRNSIETPNETGTKPFNGYGALLSIKTRDNIAMLQIAGADDLYFIREHQTANVTMKDVPWRKIALSSDIPTSLPASDVSAWAKASSKPTYTASEVGAIPVNGNAGTVNGHTVNSDVPAGAVFTDHTYNFDGAWFTSGNRNSGTQDANAMTHNGTYYYSSNGPSGIGNSTNDGALYSQAYSDVWVAQIAQDYRNGNIFTRGKNNGTWQPWKAVAYKSDIPSSIKNPNALSITANGKTVKYDGSSAQSISIQSGGSKSAKYTLTASKWSGSSAPYTYDLGSTYGNNSVIGFDSAVGSTAQLEAALSANIQGSSTTKIYAYGDKPTVDIPIVIIYQ